MSRPATVGFTLIEVAVAMAIVGITFAALFGQISSSLSNIPRIERANDLVERARTTLDAIKLIRVVAPDQSAEGGFEDGVTWRIETTNFIPPEPLDPRHLLKISVEVERDGNRMAFHTYRFQESIPPGIRPLGEQLDAIRLP